MKRHHQETNSISQAEGRKTSSLVNLVQLVVCYSRSPWRSGGIRSKYASHWSFRRNIYPVTYPRISYYINNCKWKETGCFVCSGSEEPAFLQTHVLCARSLPPNPAGTPGPGMPPAVGQEPAAGAGGPCCRTCHTWCLPEPPSLGLC